MSIIHSTAVRNAIADFVVDKLDEGSPPGTLVFLTSGDVEVATLTFANPAFGSAVAGVATSNAITADSSATGGTIAKAQARNGAGTTIFTLTVTVSDGGGDIELNALAAAPGEPVSIESATYTAAP